MTPADFEESEFRQPLYNQLVGGGSLVWEPGQVFEKHIGIDWAGYVTNPYFWRVHKINPTPIGVLLHQLRLTYLKRTRNKIKVLPNFKLNLFIQAKRPYAGTRPRGGIKRNGISGAFWKFDITPHQQKALERFANQLNKDALVCYAAPAFHTQASLYGHIVKKTIVQNSSFPPVSKLSGHSAWYYDQGGVVGVANPDFERIQMEPIEAQIGRLVERYGDHQADARETLRQLADAVIKSADDLQDPSSTDNWLQLLLARTESEVKELFDLDLIDSQDSDSVLSYFRVMAFCSAHHVEWFVLGKGY